MPESASAVRVVEIQLSFAQTISNTNSIPGEHLVEDVGGAAGTDLELASEGIPLVDGAAGGQDEDPHPASPIAR